MVVFLQVVVLGKEATPVILPAPVVLLAAIFASNLGGRAGAGVGATATHSHRRSSHCLSHLSLGERWALRDRCR